ncbi:MAG: 23S rRNA (adenine(2503)-C(2))-methyltransferase RlmN [Candidatus Margulisiibacteriota bacterium]|nr:23S rRNA (adenine(2503)-C(2))-methyltransferase RlmN [Candidatus Margulisiibacteriota bacterium]
MHDLKELTLAELIEICAGLGMKKFKAKEIFTFIHKKLKTNLNLLSTIKKEEREKLAKEYFISDIELDKLQKGKQIKKAAFVLKDNKRVETAFMDHRKDRKTVCVSTQVGCAIGCSFCATGAMGFKRSLTVGEILSQAYFFAKKSTVSNIVFMGMGEPFLNYDNVIKAAYILNDECGLNIGARRISISTIGIISGIKRLADEKRQFRLAWSLVSPFDQMRSTLIEYEGLAPIDSVIIAIQDYQKKTKRRVMIEYVVLKGINDGEKDIKKLIKIAREFDCHVNLIAYNPHHSSPFITGNIDRLESALRKANILVTRRFSLGQDISAACGQLTSKR